MFPTINFATDPAWHNVFYGEPTPGEIIKLGRFLRHHRLTHQAILYHGTSAKLDIMQRGLLPTSANRRKSLQSSQGYVCLSVYPRHAENFGKLAYPGQEIAIYQVTLLIRNLRSDKDQLRNQRLFAQRQCGDSLAESLAYGHGARVKGKIEPFQISRWIGQ